MTQEILDKEIKPFFNKLAAIEQEEFLDLKNYIKSLKSFTSKIDEIKKEHENSRKITKERFNVFTCLTRHHLEELHSKFLHYLLNPKATHDCDDLFLQAFFNQVKLKAEVDPGINYQFEKATVEREKTVSVWQPNDTRLDIYIDTPEFILAIENKIEAGEMPDQIKRYAEYCRRQNKKYIVFYLTKTGYKSETAENEKYLAISYKDEITKWLEQSIISTEQFPVVASGLKFYLDILNNSILKIPSKSVIMDLAKLLLEKENVSLLKYMKEFVGAATQIRNQLRIEFFEAVAKRLSLLNKGFKPVSYILNGISVNKIWPEVNQGLTCFEPSLILAVGSNYKIYFCIEHNGSNLWYGLFAVNSITEKGTNGNALPEIKQIKDKMAMKLPDLTLNDAYWFCTRYFYFNELGFGNDDLNYYLATDLNTGVELFLQEVCEYLTAWEETVMEYNLGK